MRFLAEYDNQIDGTYKVFKGDNNLYWTILGIMLVVYFILLIVKYFMVSVVALWSNEKLHEMMMHGLVRCPSSYFDTTPTGRLINKFSNDLGILDNMLVFVSIDSI
jgi:ATP-binding cassette subfamily C (CFTR/MRP) protein 4